MGALEGRHELDFIGLTRTVSFTDTQSRVQLLDNPDRDGPMKFVVHATEDCHLRQGGSTVAATASDFLLKAGAYAVLFVTAPGNSNISVIRGSTNGTLYITRFDDETTPGTGTSGGAADFDP